MKGFKDPQGKFRPTENKKGVRMSRDQTAKTQGVRLKRDVNETEKLENLLIERSGQPKQEVERLLERKLEKIGREYISKQGAIFLVASDLKVSLSGEDHGSSLTPEEFWELPDNTELVGKNGNYRMNKYSLLYSMNLASEQGELSEKDRKEMIDKSIRFFRVVRD